MIEIAELIEWFERLRTEDRRRVAAKTAASCAHDVGTPLNVVSGRLSLDLSQNGESKNVRVAQDAAHKLSQRMQSRLDATRYSTPTETLELRRACEAVCERLRPVATHRGVNLDVRGEATCCNWNRRALDQVLSAWLMAAMPEASGETLTVRIDIHALNRGHQGARPGTYCRVTLSLPNPNPIDPTLFAVSEEALEGFEGWFSHDEGRERIDLSFNLRSSR